MKKDNNESVLLLYKNSNVRKPNQVLEEQYKNSGSCCYYCKAATPFEQITRDHIVPASKGGKLVNNKVFACVKCNSIKSNISFEELYNKILNKMSEIILEAKDNPSTIKNRKFIKLIYYSNFLKTVSSIIKNNSTITDFVK